MLATLDILNSALVAVALWQGGDESFSWTFRRRDFHTDALDNQAVVLGAAVRREVEHRALQICREIDIRIDTDHLVFLAT